MANAADIAKRFERKFGHKAAATGRFVDTQEVTPTGILSLDFALGTMGWPSGTLIEVFGPPDIGKTTAIGFNGIVEAQKLGKTCGLIAMEPGFDPKWAEKHGVDLDNIVIVWPDDGKEAFDALYDMVMDDDIKFIVFDSIGALLREAEAGEKGKPAQGGQSGLITWGIKRIQTPIWKRKKTVILLNQIRDDMNAYIPGQVESPGGHALKHASEIRVQLKPGPDRYMTKFHGDNVMIGRSIVAIIKRTKKDEGTGKRAVFDFYQMETKDTPFGIDKETDVFNTALRTGVLTQGGGGWFYHTIFPNEGKIRGADGVKQYFKDHISAMDLIRGEVMTVMEKKREEDTNG